MRSAHSFGANAYSIVNIDGEHNRYEIRYRSFSQPQRKFVVGSEVTDSGIRYPSIQDEEHWKRLRTGTKSGLVTRFNEQKSKIDFIDWYKTNVIAKSKQAGEFVEPNVTRQEYKDGQKIAAKPRKLTESVDKSIRLQFVLGPQDSGLTTAAYLTIKHFCQSKESVDRIPVYINLKNCSVNKAAVISASVKSCPIQYSHTEMSNLINQGGVVFIFDQLCLPETARFNKLIQLLDRHFENSSSVIFCTTDGGLSTSYDPSELMFSPLNDTVFQIEPLDIKGIENLINIHRVNLDPSENGAILNNVVASFRQMDEPLYPSSVALLVETLQKIPEFRPINRVRLLDRYVECLLGRFDLDDVKEGIFNSDDKLSFLAYVAGVFAIRSIESMPVEEWDRTCKTYERDKLLDLPTGLLKEFSDKGIIILQGGVITFRADHLFSYFVAKEMQQNERVFVHISSDESFYSNHRELVYYGELEGVNNKKLLETTFQRLDLIQEEIQRTYFKNGVDIDLEWRYLLDENRDVDEKKLSDTISGFMHETPDPEVINRTRDSQLNEVDRKRGVVRRQTIKELELRWYVTIRTYLQLVKHSTNLLGSDKLTHLRKVMDSSEMFIKTLAAKRGLISTRPVYYHSGILYINPLAEIDPERSVKEFKYSVPESFADIVGNLMSNPQLSPAVRKLLNGESEITRYLVRHLLLESPNDVNASNFVNDIKKSAEIVLQTSSLRRLKEKFLGYSIDDEHRRYYSGIVEVIAADPQLSSNLQHSSLVKQRMLADMKKNLSGDAEHDS